MKTLKIILPIIFFLTFFVSCDVEDIIDVDDIEIDDPNDDDEEFDGSITSIEDFYNPQIINALNNLGFVINTGSNPPVLIEGTYLISPNTLQNTSVEGDFPIGHVFADYLATFSNQNLNNLTIDLIGVNGNQSDNGTGSFISGSGNRFSVFLKLTTLIGNVPAETAFVLSGEAFSNGFGNIQTAVIMLDDNGDPEGVYIPNNTGRVFYDSDAFSPLQ